MEFHSVTHAVLFSRGQSLDVTELWFHRHWNEPHRFHMKRSPQAPLLYSHITAIHRLQRNGHHREFTIVTYLSHSPKKRAPQRVYHCHISQSFPMRNHEAAIGVKGEVVGEKCQKDGIRGQQWRDHTYAKIFEVQHEFGREKSQ